IAAILLILAKEKTKSVWIRVAAALVAGGGIGNMIDRVRLGYVVDFIDCRFVDFYVFNIADSCVTVGCAIYFVAVLVEEIRAYCKKKAAGEAPGEAEEADASAGSGEPEASDGSAASNTEEGHGDA
ncbi:MAG: signal peptidase II, partial [Clostridia bacterium]|nr:signal peptidase II [Clostridia bacterium]